MMKKGLLIIALTLPLLTACSVPEYRQHSTIPVTNNPTVIPQKGGGMPGLKM